MIFWRSDTACWARNTPGEKKTESPPAGMMNAESTLCKWPVRKHPTSLSRSICDVDAEKWTEAWHYFRVGGSAQRWTLPPLFGACSGTAAAENAHQRERERRTTTHSFSQSASQSGAKVQETCRCAPPALSPFCVRIMFFFRFKVRVWVFVLFEISQSRCRRHREIGRARSSVWIWIHLRCTSSIPLTRTTTSSPTTWAIFKFVLTLWQRASL